MAIKKYKPTTNGRRGMSTLANEELTKTAPTKSLLKKSSKTGGRNNQGKLTVRHIGGGAKRKYRVAAFACDTVLLISKEIKLVLQDVWHQLNTIQTVMQTLL